MRIHRNIVNVIKLSIPSQLPTDLHLPLYSIDRKSSLDKTNYIFPFLLEGPLQLGPSLIEDNVITYRKHILQEKKNLSKVNLAKIFLM